jgi:hypothetical protein
MGATKRRQKLQALSRPGKFLFVERTQRIAQKRLLPGNEKVVE